ncbi:MAG: hypothetical protein EAY75_15635 [Bacteroidetes bacterium]|nr:MAG: hypothetical protein EAY75_15635 [Bacteroidota bacterium]
MHNVKLRHFNRRGRGAVWRLKQMVNPCFGSTFWLTLLLFSACQPAGSPAHPSGKAAAKVKPTVLLQPFNETDAAAISFLQKHLADSLHVEVKILPAKLLPANSWYAARKRYWADSILQMLKKMAPPNAKVLGVTGCDIATRNARHTNWGVMGLGFLPGNAAVVSTYRLHRDGLTVAQLQQRLLKVALHELGHNFGLPHCANAHCLMADAEGKDKLNELDAFCQSCRAKLPQSVAER